MRLTRVNLLKNGNARLHVYKDKEKIKVMELIKGKEYICIPMNPLKMKNRNRTFEILDFMNEYARVKYSDTRASGRVNYEDIAQVE